MNLSFRVEGLDGALKRIDSYNKKRLRERSKAGFKVAGPVLRDAVKAAAPTGPTGNLKRSTRYKSLRGDPPAMVVGPRHSIRRRRNAGPSEFLKRKRKATAPHAHLVIMGTKDRYTAAVNKRGIRIGQDIVRRSANNRRMPANPYVERGVMAALPAAMAKFKEAFDDR